ncbi:MAG: DUF922 domain-containing protein [Bacteroidota bacterium]
MVKWKFALTAIVFLLPLLMNAQQGDDFIKWSADRKLKWQDYLAEPDSRSDAAASTSTQIGFEYHIRDNNLTYAITCRFSKAKSWGRYKNDYILSHEQGHFDIAEIFTRKFAKAMKEYTFNKETYKNDLRNIYSAAMKDKERFQQQYDSETDYSRIKEKQVEWLKKIEKMLDEYKAFSDYN